MGYVLDSLRAALGRCHTVRFTAGADLVGGQMLLIGGQTFGVVVADAASGEEAVAVCATDSQGIVLPCDGSIFIIGNDLYFNEDTGEVTSDVQEGDHLIGKALNNSAGGQSTCRVWLIQQPQRSLLGYSRWIGKIVQAGTGNPVETILLDDTGLGLFNFNRVGVGEYSATVSGSFKDRTTPIIYPSVGYTGTALRYFAIKVVDLIPGSLFQVVINTFDETGALADGVMGTEIDTTVEIRIHSA